MTKKARFFSKIYNCFFGRDSEIDRKKSFFSTKNGEMLQLGLARCQKIRTHFFLTQQFHILPFFYLTEINRLFLFC